MSGNDDALEPKKAKRGRPPIASYAAAADLAWTYHLGGMSVNKAVRAAIECICHFGSLDLRGLVAGATGPIPDEGLLPAGKGAKKRGPARSLSVDAHRSQRPAHWGEGGDEFTQPRSPRYILASNDTVVEQVAAMVRKRKKASGQK